MTRNRKMTPSLVDVASSAEHRRKMTVTDDHVKPVPSDLYPARTSAIDTADAAGEVKHVTSVRRACITIRHTVLPRISIQSFSRISKQSRRCTATHSIGYVSHVGYSYALRRPLYRGLAITHVRTWLGPPPQEDVRACNRP